MHFNLMGPIGCPETSVGNYHYSLRYNPEERSLQLLGGGSLKLRTIDLLTLKLQASEHPPLATSPHPVNPSARSANSSTGQNRALQYKMQYRTSTAQLCRTVRLKRRYLGLVYLVVPSLTVS